MKGEMAAHSYNGIFNNQRKQAFKSQKIWKKLKCLIQNERSKSEKAINIHIPVF
jgi:hypothetical protein